MDENYEYSLSVQLGFVTKGVYKKEFNSELLLDYRIKDKELWGFSGGCLEINLKRSIKRGNT